MAKNEEVKTVYVVDLDNVLCDLDTAFYKMAYVILGREIDYESYINRSMFSLEECGLLQPDELHRLLVAVEVLGFYQNLEMFPGAAEFLNGISRASGKLIYLTSREPTIKIINDTMKWFSISKLQIPEVRNSMNMMDLGSRSFEIVFDTNKIDFLKAIKNGERTKDMRMVYVEDDPHYIRMAKVAGADKIYTFDYPYARELEPEDNILMVEHPASGGLLQIAENEGFKI